MSPSSNLNIGTRGSPLALAQAYEARDTLAANGGNADMQLVEIKTSGDNIQDRPLADVGGKGLFAKELDAALLDGRIDVAVHSLKDLETVLPEGIVLAACLKREDPRDAFICSKVAHPGDLPDGATVGTASLRRQAQLLHRRPDLKVTLLRGNIQTRMRKIDAGEADATFLALAGLNRMGLADRARYIMAPEEMLPACGQGAIGITCRVDDTDTRDRLEAINHLPTMSCVRAERAMLAALDGSCRTPIGGLAELSPDGEIHLRGLVARADGSELFQTDGRAAATDAEALGRELGVRLRGQAGTGLFD